MRSRRHSSFKKMINSKHIINGSQKRHKRYERDGAHRRDYRDDKNSSAQRTESARTLPSMNALKK